MTEKATNSAMLSVTQGLLWLAFTVCFTATLSRWTKEPPDWVMFSFAGCVSGLCITFTAAACLAFADACEVQRNGLEEYEKVKERMLAKWATHKTCDDGDKVTALPWEKRKWTVS